MSMEFIKKKMVPGYHNNQGSNIMLTNCKVIWSGRPEQRTKVSGCYGNWIYRKWSCFSGEVSSAKVNVKHSSRVNGSPRKFLHSSRVIPSFCLVGKTLRQKLYQLVIAVKQTIWKHSDFKQEPWFFFLPLGVYGLAGKFCSSELSSGYQWFHLGLFKSPQALAGQLGAG